MFVIGRLYIWWLGYRNCLGYRTKIEINYKPSFVSVDYAGEERTDVGARTYEEQDHGQQALKVKYGRLEQHTTLCNSIL